MAGGYDLQTVALAIGVVLLFGWFYWSVAHRMIGSLRKIAAILDGGAER